MRFSEVDPAPTAAPAAELVMPVLANPGRVDFGFDESSWAPVIGVRVERTGRNMVRVTVDELGFVSELALELEVAAVAGAEDLLSEEEYGVAVVLKLRG